MVDGEKATTGSVVFSPLQILNIMIKSKNGERVAAEKCPTVMVNNTGNPMFGSRDYSTLFMYQTEQF